MRKTRSSLRRNDAEKTRMTDIRGYLEMRKIELLEKHTGK